MVQKFKTLGKVTIAVTVTALTTAVAAQPTGPQVTWHWHMHQPIYWNDQKNGAPDRYEYAWESIVEKDGGRQNPENNLREIFGKDDRVAAYQFRMRDALGSIGGNHPNSGAVTSYSGALMENVKSLGDANQLGYSPGWKDPLIQANNWTAGTGAPRLDFVEFSFHHALLALHNEETVRMELLLTREIYKREFGDGAIGQGIFPTEMCFSTRLIPVFAELGIEWSIVSGEKIARATPDFPLVLGSGGVNTSPPNKADQINPNGEVFIRQSIDRGCSPVNANPLSYQPAYAQYVDPATGEIDKIIVVPADQAAGWNDGYRIINADFIDDLEARNDPNQPSLVLLSHDGDNAFAGGFSYYAEGVPNVANDAAARGGAATSVQEYLNNFPPNPNNVIHVEDGGWVNPDSDFGSPSFINWNYPLIDAQGNLDPVNGWHEKPRDMAIFTATLNRVLTAQQISGHEPDLTKILDPNNTNTHPVERAWHYHLGSLDSGNVYFGPALDLEVKATIGANEAVQHTDPIIGDGTGDMTPPTIWLPQRSPYNPGGVNFGVQHGYQEFRDDGDFHIWTFIHDVSGPADAVLKYRIDVDGENPLDSTQNETFTGGPEVGEWVELPMNRRVFPKDNVNNNPSINFFELPTHISDHYSVEVVDLREVLIDYYIEATDQKGNTSRSPIQHVWIGDGSNPTTGGGGGGGGGGGMGTAEVDPDPPVRGEDVTITYNSEDGPLEGTSNVYIELGKNSFQNVITPRPELTNIGTELWEYTYTVPLDATQINFAFTDTQTGGSGIFDNNGGLGVDWDINTVGDDIVDPDENPFNIDGILDDDVCSLNDELYVDVIGDWLYVAGNAIGGRDAYIHVSTNPSTMQAMNWGKSGLIGRWDYFLAMESSNNFQGWFDSVEALIDENSNSNFESARNGTFIEGALNLANLGTASPFIVFSQFETNDAGILLSQTPEPTNDNLDIEPEEYIQVSEQDLPCIPVELQRDDFWIFY